MLQGRYEEAVQLAELFDGALPDMSVQVKWQGVRAKLAARRGELERAETLAREAVSLAEQTDYLVFRADAFLDLAEVLRLAGRLNEAEGALCEALRLHEQKGNVVAAAKARASLAEFEGARAAGRRP
jgi:ATP/maltotriose-dependent transcriptional regulator MalT